MYRWIKANLDSHGDNFELTFWDLEALNMSTLKRLYVPIGS
jgi:hypothetical protein